MDAVQDVLGPFHVRIRSVVERAWAERRAEAAWRQESGLDPLLYSRTIANYVFDAIARIAVNEFASDASVTAHELDLITAELNIRLMHLARFLEGVDYNTTANVPNLDVEQYGQPEKIAATVRAHWGIPSGPIKNLMYWVERAGIVVGFSKFGGASVSGVTFKVAGRPPLVLLNSSHPADRMRFALAHEIGHLVMHRFPTESMEPEANEFASALLLPAADIRQSFRGRRMSLELLAALKPEWKVAMQALLMRATSLNCVTPNQARYLWQQISTRGWRLREPAELDFPIEVPTVLPSIVRAHLTDLGYSMSELTKLIRIREGEFVEMYGVTEAMPPSKPKLQIMR